MRSRRLQILITLMFVTMMFVQTPAQAGTTNATLIKNGSNTNVNDYQKDNPTSFGKTSSVDTTSSTSNLNAISKISSVNSNLGLYNQSGTVMQTNSTYYHPGQYVDVNLTSSQLSNFNFTNAFTYALTSQDGETPLYNSTNTVLQNTTTQTTTDISQSWKGQSLYGSTTYNTTSVSDIYGVSVSTPTPANVTANTVRIDWNTVGNTTSTVSYGFTNQSTTSWSYSKTVDGFRNSHTVYLNSLIPNKKYFYQFFGRDYFGRVIKSQTYSFFTQQPTAGYPTITNVSVSLLTPDTSTANIHFDSNLLNNYTLRYATSRTALDNKLGTTKSETLSSPSYDIQLSTLQPGTTYYFEINATSGSFTTSDTNNGHYYSFTTKPLSYKLVTNPTVTFNATSSEATVTFSTNSTVNASIDYSMDPFFSSGTISSTSYGNSTFVHTITFPIMRAVTYFYRIRITDGINTYSLINSYSSFNYFSFKTPKSDSQDVNLAQFNFVLHLPLYPATLGNYRFTLTINRTLISGVSYPAIDKNNLNFYVDFLVNDTLNFTQQEVLVQRGTYTNETGTYPIWMNDTESTYSPTDNLLFIGTMAYSTSLNQKVNTSEITTGGLVNLYFNGKQISAGSNNIYSATDVISGSSNLKMNASLLSNTNYATTKILNVKIPAKDIYGNMTVQMGLTFPHSTGWSTDYTQYQNLTTPTDVRYRLELVNSTGKSSYFLTTTDLVGSATILPVHYTNITQVYPDGNQSNFLKIPTSEINLTLSVKLNNEVQNIFELHSNNYTWYWNRKTLESSLKTGNYTLQLVWSNGPGVYYSDSVYSSSPKTFSYSFTLEVQFTVLDLTHDITVLPGNDVVLRFKIIVPQTKIAWDQNLNASVDGKDAAFDPITGEYSVTISVPSTATDGNKSLTVSLANEQLTGNTAIFYKISSQPDISMSSGASTVNTKSFTDAQVSLLGFGMLGMALVVTAGYGAFILFTMRRK